MKLFLLTALVAATAQANSCTKESCLFSVTNPDNVYQGRCGEVDAAPRMPADIFKDQRAVAEYVLATTKWYHVDGVQLKQQPCNHTGRTQTLSKNVSWTDPTLMKYTCDSGCSCNYPFCPDQPDVPRNHQYCSLCGPKFNQPIEVKFWYRNGPAPTPAPGKAGCTKDACPFSYNNPISVHDGRCGEVDASSRMPADIFNDPERVQEYVLATTKWYHVDGVTLVNAPCNHENKKIETQSVSWTDPTLMHNACNAECSCNYPSCPDQPDVPRNHQYCSLCGPKFNKNITVTFYYPQ